MQWDPTRWLISLAGFNFDWIITREWSRSLLCFLPVFLLGGIVVAAASGNWRDRGRLAQWYLELGDEEIAEWEQSWAPVAGEAKPVASDRTKLASVTNADDMNGQTKDSPSNSTPVSRFAETLFRRGQMLAPSERSQYVIAATLAQRGAIDQAKLALAKVAPDNANGYAPAHGLQAMMLFGDLQKEDPEKVTREHLERLKHHIENALRWERCPQSLLRAGSDLYWVAGDRAKSLAMLAISAERHPEDNFLLAQRAQMAGEERLFEHAWPLAEQHLLAELETDVKNTTARLQLAQIYAMTEQFERSEEVLGDPKIERTPEISRALSQLYLMRYNGSQSLANEKYTVNLQFLETAMRFDASNPLVAEEVAKLARMQGQAPSEELIENLKTKLADGTATAVTHACIAEMRLINRQLALAIPHLEQVVTRLPEAADSLNNLAFCLAELHPERLQEALLYATRAVAASKQQPNPDYFDTLSIVLSKLDRHKEAITAIETAIELDRRRPDFHERAASEYKALGDESMAQVHLGVIERLKIEEAQRIEQERLAAERRAIQEKIEQERLEAERLKLEKLEEIRFASEQAMAAIADEVAREQALKQKKTGILQEQKQEDSETKEVEKK